MQSKNWVPNTMFENKSDILDPLPQGIKLTQVSYSDEAPSADLRRLDAVQDVLVVFESCKL
jgi:hypothetical protein